MIRIQKKTGIVLKVLLFSGVAALLVFLTVKYVPRITELASRPEEFKNMLHSYGHKSAVIFILFQVLQIVIAAIPGEFMQMAGGYIYGTFKGTLYLMIGMMIGSIIVFYLSRTVGYPLVKVFVSRQKLEKFAFLMNSQKSEVAMFVLFLIPGFPKDVLTYIAGLTPVKPARFIVIAAVARFPALLVSAFIGSNLSEKDYFTVVIISVVAVVLFLAGLLFRERLIHRIKLLLHPGASD